MIGRDWLRHQFLQSHNWDKAGFVPLTGDASNRQYFRLTRGPQNQGALLMDAEPETSGLQDGFLRMAEYLIRAGFSAPRIFAADTLTGFILLEDFGDALFSKLAATNPDREATLYCAAADYLLALHRQPAAAGLAIATPRVLAQMVAPAFDWYGVRAAPDMSHGAKSATIERLHDCLSRHAPMGSVTVLRDFHAENLIWLPDRQAAARVGLLDFQDAVIGHPAYDLVSLTRDARRDLGPGVSAQTTERYLAGSTLDREVFLTAAAVLSVQRNLRILGVFVRLAFVAQKPHYLDLMPRVWGHLMRDLAHPVLRNLARVITDSLPPPEALLLTALKAACPKLPPH
jgi:aminoglycoside/choline kinase family phosphotransferase